MLDELLSEGILNWLDRHPRWLLVVILHLYFQNYIIRRVNKMRRGKDARWRWRWWQVWRWPFWYSDAFFLQAPRDPADPRTQQPRVRRSSPSHPDFQIGPDDTTPKA